MSERISIPAAVALEVRQRAGFACVVCGCPLYEIHHIDPYAIVMRHDPENLAPLCPNHHAEATKKLLLPDDVRRAKARPAALERGTTAPYPIRFSGERCTVWFGDSDQRNVDGAKSYVALMIDNVPLVGFEFRDGAMLLHLNLLDDQNDPSLIARGGLLQLRPNAWDIRFRGRRLTLWESRKHIRLQLEICPPDVLRIRQGLFMFNGVAFKVAPRAMACLNLGWVWSCSEMTPADSGQAQQVGIALGRVDETLRPALAITGVPRYRQVDLNQRLRSPRPREVVTPLPAGPIPTS